MSGAELAELELVTAAEAHRAAAAAGIVVIACGAAKLPYRAPAKTLYRGQHFMVCRATAEEIAPGRWWILSAAHGLVDPEQWIEPYDMRLDSPAAVTSRRLADQALELGLLGEPVMALCGAGYADLLAAVWPDVRRPLAGLGIGLQRGMLRRIREAA